MTKLTEDLYFREKTFTTGGCLFLHVYDHYSQITFLKTAWPIKTKLYVEPSLKEGT